MKTLLLMRHAKSSWKKTDLQDHERPLNKRGEKDAPRMGKWLLERNLTPQFILSSTAVRAAKTAELVAGKCNYKNEILYSESLYLAEPQGYIQALQALPDDYKRVLIIGHNPGLEGLLQMLTGKVEGLPTGSLAWLVLPIKNWAELDLNTESELIEIWRPREL
jgi:phosphohistidine phosphatase